MVMFDFGERNKILDFRGNEKEVGELALHVQCRWRITTESHVVVGSRDINYPADYSEDQEIREGFDWDRDPNRLDKLVRVFFGHHEQGLVVQGVAVGDAGSLQISLAEGLSLDVFPDDSLNQEHWRLFKPDTNQPHFVFTPTRT